MVTRRRSGRPWMPCWSSGRRFRSVRSWSSSGRRGDPEGLGSRPECTDATTSAAGQRRSDLVEPGPVKVTIRQGMSSEGEPLYLDLVGWVDGWAGGEWGPAMPTTRRPRPAEERAALEARRLQAAELFAQGHTQAEVARSSVSPARAPMSGTPASPRAGWRPCAAGPDRPRPQAVAAQLAMVEQALLAGRWANGFDTDLWTLERVAVVITQLTGVRHHPGHVWWFCAIASAGPSSGPSGGPANEMRRRSLAGCSRSGRGSRGRRRIGLARLLRRIGRLTDPTGAPDLVTRGATRRSCATASAGRRPPWRPRSATGPTAPRPGCAFTSRSPATTPTASSACWSNWRLLHRPTSRAHLGRAVGPLEHQDARLAGQPARLAAAEPARLRTELNPVEDLWANLEDVELANLPTTTLAEVADATEQGIHRVCKHQDLVVGFLAHTGLSLDP